MASILINWKTSLGGVGLILLGILGLVGVAIPGVPTDSSAAFGMIIAGITALFAKDNNVTGGTIKQ